MQIRLRASRLELSSDDTAHIHRRIEFALRRFAPRLRRVEVRLVDENGERGGIDKRCAVGLHLRNGTSLHVEAFADAVVLASDLALERAGRALSRRIARSRHFALRSASGLAS